jgi:3-oxoacyl-[acyl-carrier protein] reductase
LDGVIKMSQVILVTGGGGAICSAICRGLYADGHSVVIADLDLENAEKLARDLGERALAVHVDVGNEDSVNGMVEQTLKRFDRIDVLLNGAGVMPRHQVQDITRVEWDNVIRINLTGVFLCSKAVIPPMIGRKQGRIISIVSNLALSGAPGSAHYAASKAGVVALTKSLAVELAPHNILVNAFGPGRTDTPMSRTGASEEVWKKRKSLPPILGGFTLSDDIVGLVRYLISDATKNVTEQIFFLKARD